MKTWLVQVYLFICLFVCLFVCLFIYLFVYLFIYLFIYLFTYLIYLFIWTSFYYDKKSPIALLLEIIYWVVVDVYFSCPGFLKNRLTKNVIQKRVKRLRRFYVFVDACDFSLMAITFCKTQKKDIRYQK